jgi:aminoglycoside phosphotransferase (APT) family kinase protein
MSDGMLEPGGAAERDEATGIPYPALVESWLRTLTAFEDARIVAVVPLTDGLSNVTCRVELADAPVGAAVLRIQPTRGIFEPYDILRESEVLKHLAGTAVPVPGVLAAESDPRFFGAPFLLLESIDGPVVHVGPARGPPNPLPRGAVNRRRAIRSGEAVVSSCGPR